MILFKIFCWKYLKFSNNYYLNKKPIARHVFNYVDLLWVKKISPFVYKLGFRGWLKEQTLVESYLILKVFINKMKILKLVVSISTLSKMVASYRYPFIKLRIWLPFFRMGLVTGPVNCSVVFTLPIKNGISKKKLTM